MIIGYLIPEFPGQTHIFFWREREALKQLGIKTALISTRLPQQGIISHEWSQAAIAETSYLVPFSPKDYWIALKECCTSGPQSWVRCWWVMVRAEHLSLIQRFRFLAMMLVAGKLVWLARQQGWTHLHVHSCADSANIALLAHLLSGCSYSLTLHGPLADYGLNQAQKWRFAQFGIVITQTLYEEVHQQLGAHLPDTLNIAPMGVNVNRFKRTAPYRPWQPSRCCQLFSCGRLNVGKGHEDVIRAVALLKAKGIYIRLDIAGEDEQGGSGYHQQLDALIAALQLGDSVCLLGAVSEERIRQHLESAHIFILASLNEPLGVAIMEAMAMEVPVVVTAAGGVKELVDHEINGILIQPRSPHEIVDAVLKIMKQPEVSLQLGHLARQKVLDQFNDGRSAAAIATCLSERSIGGCHP